MTIDNLECLAQEIIQRNDIIFPKWRTIHPDEAERHIYWTNAMAGEVGELCNGSKKHHRYLKDWVGKTYNHEEYKDYASEELADIFIYLILYSELLDVDLPMAVRRKVEINYKERFK